MLIEQNPKEWVIKQEEGGIIEVWARAGGRKEYCKYVGLAEKAKWWEYRGQGKGSMRRDEAQEVNRGLEM